MVKHQPWSILSMINTDLNFIKHNEYNLQNNYSSSYIHSVHTSTPIKLYLPTPHWSHQHLMHHLQYQVDEHDAIDKMAPLNTVKH